MTNFLFAKNKIEIVDGTIAKPEKGTKDYMAWMRVDAMIKGWLTTAMEKNIRSSVKYAETASEIWTDLNERFGKESAPRAYELKHKIASTRQNNASVSTYFTQLRSIWDEAQSIYPFPRCTCKKCECDVGKKLNEHQEKERLYEFLMGLDMEFAVIRTQILATKPTPSLGTAYHMVAEDERQRAVSTDNAKQVESAAFKAFQKRNFYAGPSKEKTMTKLTKEEHCTECNKDGHIREACFRVIGYPEWWPGKKGEKYKGKAACVEGSPIPGLTEKDYQTFLKHFSGSGVEENSKGVANMAHKEGKEGEWIIDSGCTDYITCLPDILVNKKATEVEAPVLIPNGDSVPVKGKGDYILPGGRRVNGVLYIPNFNCNLLSVSRLSRDLQCSITFFPDFCVMQGLLKRNLIGTGRCRGGLYRMKMIQERKAMATTVDTWHKRLGHASKGKLARVNFLKNSINNLGNFCDPCAKAKHTRLPFSSSFIKTNAPFELIHCDIWGGYRVPSYTKANYFLTIVDDFSRAVWIFLLKHKSEASQYLKDFHKMIEVQFEKENKKIRCDNGGEFTSTNMIDFYNKKGIILETTCPHTPQQNGVVERKHRHLVETARALRIDAHLPKMFWGECILTAAYIINRLPSKVIKNKTPFELIWNKEPDYDFLKVFGCLVYFKNTDTKGDKFEERGKPGVFLGYPPRTKGYKIYDLETRKMVVSRDVNFHEGKFPFKNIEENYENNDVEPMIYHDCHCDDASLLQNKEQNLHREQVNNIDGLSEIHQMGQSENENEPNSSESEAIEPSGEAIEPSGEAQSEVRPT